MSMFDLDFITLELKAEVSSVTLLYSRLVSMVVTLREWAHKSLQEEEERPDSFLERFRGPELRITHSRNSSNHPDPQDAGVKTK